MCQLLNQDCCLQNIQALVKLPFTELRLLSKGLVARLIPTDIASDDRASLMLVKDDEIDLLIGAFTSIRSCRTIIPLIPVMMDLSRSPHNVSAFASKNVASVLSDVMDSISEDDQDRAAQLIWMMMESNDDGSENESLLTNNGTMQDLSGLVEGVRIFNKYYGML